MNENWTTMPVDAPLTRESVDTGYPKEENFKEMDHDAAIEDTMILVGELEDYFGEMEEQEEITEEAEAIVDEYDDDEDSSEIPAETYSTEEVFTDIYSDEEY